MVVANHVSQRHSLRLSAMERSYAAAQLSKPMILATDFAALLAQIDRQATVAEDGTLAEVRAPSR